MERTIDKLDEQKVINELKHRRSLFLYRVRVMSTVLPVLRKYEGKKVTKHIQTAVNKHLQKNTPKFLGRLECYIGGICGDKDELIFQYNDVKCKATGRPLLDHQNQFRMHLGKSEWKESTRVYDDISSNRNSYLADSEKVTETIQEYENSIKEAKKIVSKNNKIYKQLKELRKYISKEHSANQYAMQ